MDIIRTHGVGGYNAGCRCDICREAKAIKRKQYQSSKAWHYQKTYRERLKQNNPEKFAELKRKNNEYKKKAFANDPEKNRWQAIFKKYKLTKYMYEQLLAEQNGVCAICSKKPTRNYLSVDHDHSCCPGIKTCGNCIRGLLCQSCNSFLGRVDDNLTTAINYLETYRQKGGDANA
jgi:hypothetical protein